MKVDSFGIKNGDLKIEKFFIHFMNVFGWSKRRILRILIEKDGISLAGADRVLQPKIASQLPIFRKTKFSMFVNFCDSLDLDILIKRLGLASYQISKIRTPANFPCRLRKLSDAFLFYILKTCFLNHVARLCDILGANATRKRRVSRNVFQLTSFRVS